MKKITSIVALMRPKHWVKNLFIFLPAFFAGLLELIFFDYKLILAFISFCLAASTIYIFNDIMDVDKDQQHPKKKYRPIAANKVSVLEGYILMVVLLLIAVILAFTVGAQGVIISYIVLNILYTLKLKHISLLDVSIISIGFVLRVITGGIVGDLLISKWIILMTFLLAMCLGFGKRRDELKIAQEKNVDIRTALAGYNLDFLNICLVGMSMITIICYIMYTVSEDVIQRLNTEYIYITSFFVIMGILRFLQIVLVEEESGSPTDILLKDRFIQLVLLGWFLIFGFLIY